MNQEPFRQDDIPWSAVLLAVWPVVVWTVLFLATAAAGLVLAFALVSGLIQ